MKGAYKTIIVFFLIDWAIASFHVNETKWLTWKKQHHKEYASTVEEEMRRHIWNENMHYILKHNSGQMSFQMELNEFADRSAHEMVGATTLIGEMEKRYPYHNEFQYAPASFDWRQKGAVPPVHNQGQLGDAVAYAVTDCVGSYHMIQTGRLVSLSVQETSDCCTHGHFATNVLGCIKQLGGLCSEADYPRITGKCHSSSCHVAAQIKGSVSVRPGNETDLQLSVLRNPVLVLIDASHRSFQLYRTGVYEESKCSATRLDHALLLVGYGSMSGRDYWICKNSWGTSWGMQGYVLIARNKNNMCGIASAASLPI